MTDQPLPLRPVPPPKPEPDPLPRIEALTRNARNTWLVLLGVLVFVGITLMGFEHIDLYGAERATALPLVDVEVPTRLFFGTAALLLAAVYGYLHLYLIRLWDVLGEAEPEQKGQPLGDAITPWLVSDTALFFRRRRRADVSAAPRSADWVVALFNVLLAWVFGLVVLGLLWWQVMTARSLWMTGFATAAFLVAFAIGATSWLLLRRRMAGLGQNDHRPFWRTAGIVLLALLANSTVLAISFERTRGGLGIHEMAKEVEQSGRGLLLLVLDDSSDRHRPFSRILTPVSDFLFGLAPIDLAGEDLVVKPQGWLPHAYARDEFRASWCAREEIDDCKELPEADAARRADEWRARRAARLADLTKPRTNPVSPSDYDTMTDAERAAATATLDLRNADLREAFLTGANLILVDLGSADLLEARMEGADLRGARMEGAVLTGARMEGADLFGARMEGADLTGARMEGANLFEARMEGADLRGARMEGAVLSGARMEGADLRGARMEGAVLTGARMEGADLSGARMEGADLSGARMEGADLFGARMEGADLSYSRLTGTADAPNLLQSTNLRASTNDGGALRFVDLRPAEFDVASDFRNAFLDGSVLLPDGFAERMGLPCQWVWAGVDSGTALSDHVFHARWRGWVEPHLSIFFRWSDLAPPEFADIAPEAPPPGCQWKTGPMPRAETQP